MLPPRRQIQRYLPLGVAAADGLGVSPFEASVLEALALLEQLVDGLHHAILVELETDLDDLLRGAILLEFLKRPPNEVAPADAEVVHRL